MNVSKKEPEMFILINHNFTIISLLHCANSKPKFRNQFMTQLTVRNKNCILRDNIMHIQSLHFNTFIISCEIRSDFPYQSPLIEMDQLLSLSVVGANAQCSVKFELWHLYVSKLHFIVYSMKKNISNNSTQDLSMHSEIVTCMQFKLKIVIFSKSTVKY